MKLPEQEVLGRQLRTRLGYLNLTTVELAERSGVSRTTIWRLLQGHGGQLRTLLALTRALGLRLEARPYD